MRRKKLTFHFKPHHKGLTAVLGELETEIMHILWRQGEGSVREVVQTLSQTRNIAFNTVMTVMNRLVEKGLLDKVKRDNVYIYQPLYSQQEFASQVSRAVLEGVLDNYGNLAISSFVDLLDHIDMEKLGYLRRLLQEKQRQKTREERKPHEEEPSAGEAH
jgi:predicted transcriptional regulator